MCGNLSINGAKDPYSLLPGNRTSFLFTNVFLPAALVRFYFVIFSIIRGDIYNFWSPWPPIKQYLQAPNQFRTSSEFSLEPVKT